MTQEQKSEARIAWLKELGLTTRDVYRDYEDNEFIIDVIEMEHGENGFVTNKKIYLPEELQS